MLRSLVELSSAPHRLAVKNAEKEGEDYKSSSNNLEQGGWGLMNVQLFISLAFDRLTRSYTIHENFTLNYTALPSS